MGALARLACFLDPWTHQGLCSWITWLYRSPNRVGSRGAVVSASLSKRKVAGSIPMIGDFHTVGPCENAIFACLATDEIR